MQDSVRADSFHLIRNLLTELLYKIFCFGYCVRVCASNGYRVGC